MGKKPRQGFKIFVCIRGQGSGSNNGKGVLKLVERMKKANVKDVRVKLYEDCRHELLNELNRKWFLRIFLILSRRQ